VHVLRTVFVFFTLTIMAATAFSQATDRHLTSGDSQALFKKSTYAHAYMHGYEDGFHNADVDIHMGRGERSVSQLEDFKACSGYRKEFGDKRFYRDGYRQGFSEGYADGINRRDFRAIAGARKAAVGLTATANDQGVERDFDEAFSRGYASGRKSDADMVRGHAESDYALNLCQSKASHSKNTNSREYCDAFSRGFSLGFFDATSSSPKTGMQTARKESEQRPPR
jgi:hypothetical protein